MQVAVAAIAVAVLIFDPSTGSSASGARVCRWQSVTSPTITNGILNAVDARSGSPWAVGATYRDSGDAAVAPLIERWSQGRWTTVGSSHVDGAELNGVAVIDAADVWAVGGSSGAALIEHWDGRTWRTVGLPSGASWVTGKLSAVSAVEANDVWVVGNWSSDRGFVLHWDGSHWAQLAQPAGRAQDVAAVAADNIWVVSDGEASHWDGHGFRRFRLLPPVGTEGPYLEGVAATGGEAWAVGWASVSGGMTGEIKSVLYRWDGQRWSRRVSRTPTDNWDSLLDVIARSPTEVWSTGMDLSYMLGDYPSFPSSDFYVAPPSGTMKLAAKLGRGQVVTALALDRSRTLWGVGYTAKHINRDSGYPDLTSPLIEHYACAH